MLIEARQPLIEVEPPPSFDQAWQKLFGEARIPVALEQLYHNKEVITFVYEPFSEKHGVELHIAKAFAYIDLIIQDGLRERKGGFGFVGAAMSAGKTKLIAWLAEAYDAQVFKHKLDRGRFALDEAGKAYLCTQEGEQGLNTGVEAQEYETVGDLISKIDVNGSRVVVVDEFQFAGFKCNEAGGIVRSGKASEAELDQLYQFADENGLIIIFSNLDATFNNQAFSNVELLLPRADLFRVNLTALCTTDDCGRAAFQTMREVFENGIWRVAFEDEDAVVVGSVHQDDKRAERYRACCPGCHRVLKAEDRTKWESPDWEYVYPGEFENKWRGYPTLKKDIHGWPERVIVDAKRGIGIPKLLRMLDLFPIKEWRGKGEEPLLVAFLGETLGSGKTKATIAAAKTTRYIGLPVHTLLEYPNRAPLSLLQDSYKNPEEFFLRSQQWFLEYTLRRLIRAPKDKLLFLDVPVEANANYPRLRLVNGTMSAGNFLRYAEFFDAQPWDKVPRPASLVYLEHGGARGAIEMFHRSAEEYEATIDDVFLLTHMAFNRWWAKEVELSAYAPVSRVQASELPFHIKARDREVVTPAQARLTLAALRPMQQRIIERFGIDPVPRLEELIGAES